MNSLPLLLPPGADAGGRSEQAPLLRAVLAAVADLVYVIDLRGSHERWLTPALTRLLGWSEAELTECEDELSRTLVHPDDLARLDAADEALEVLADGAVAETRVRLMQVQGNYRLVLRRTTPLSRDDDLALVQAVVSARDITQVEEVERQLTQAALHDPLTGLPNRGLLVDRLDNALDRRRRGGHVVPVLFCDLDGFKRVNDTSGHQAGDAVLTATAQRLVSALRPQDTVARVGGDEFVIVLETANDETPPIEESDGPVGLPAVVRRGSDASIRADTLVIVERLVAALRDPIRVTGDGLVIEHTISVSIGVTFAEPGSTPEQVLQQADSAMYRAKDAGKDRYAVFTSSHSAEVVERGHVERTLRAALRRGVDLVAADVPGPPTGDERPGRGGPRLEQPARLSVAYQPVFDLAGMELIGVEALARLTDHYGLALAPEAFIPIAEQSGLIAELGRTVLQTACHDLAGWHARFPAWRHLGLAVNLSARQAGLIDLVDLVDTALDDSGLAPSLLTLELTESVLLAASRSTITALNELHAQGVQLAIDDFGTGYASMSYLAQLPVSTVKVDKSFTAGLPDDATCTVIVRTIATLARDLGLSCVVEGIETAEQLRALPAGVHGQGFLLGRPVPAVALGVLLTTAAHRPLVAPPPEVGSAGSRTPRSDRRAAAWPDGPAGPGRHPQASGQFRTELAIDREAAADERQDTADHRDQLADRRDVLADRREQTNVQYELDLDALLAHAQRRDQLAVSRDLRAGDRDAAAVRRDDGVTPGDAAGRTERSSTSGDRVHARMDRLHGARDRDAAAGDRRRLLDKRSHLQAGQLAGSLVRHKAAATRTTATAMRDTRTATDERGPEKG